MNIPVHGIRLLRRHLIITRTGISIPTGATGTARITAGKALTNSLSKEASLGTRTTIITITDSDRYAAVD
jgi:hypothetical protein